MLMYVRLRDMTDVVSKEKKSQTVKLIFEFYILAFNDPALHIAFEKFRAGTSCYRVRLLQG